MGGLSNHTCTFKYFFYFYIGKCLFDTLPRNNCLLFAAMEEGEEEGDYGKTGHDYIADFNPVIFKIFKS